MAEEIRPQQVGPQNPDLSWRWVVALGLWSETGGAAPRGQVKNM